MPVVKKASKRTRDDLLNNELGLEGKRKKSKTLSNSPDQPASFIDFISEQNSLFKTRSLDDGVPFLFDSTGYFNKMNVLSCSELRELGRFVCLYLAGDYNEDVYMQGKLHKKSTQHPSLDIYELTPVHPPHIQLSQIYVLAGTAVLLPLLQHKYYEQFSGYFLKQDCNGGLEHIRHLEKIENQIRLQYPSITSEEEHTYMEENPFMNGGQQNLRAIGSNVGLEQQSLSKKVRPSKKTLRPRYWRLEGDGQVKNGLKFPIISEDQSMVEVFREEQRLKDLRFVRRTFLLSCGTFVFSMMFAADWEDADSLRAELMILGNHLVTKRCSKNALSTHFVYLDTGLGGWLNWLTGQSVTQTAEYICIAYTVLMFILRVTVFVLANKALNWIGLQTSMTNLILLPAFAYASKSAVKDITQWILEQGILQSSIPFIVFQVSVYVLVLFDRSSTWMISKGSRLNIRPFFFQIIMPMVSLALALCGGMEASKSLINNAM